MRITSVDQLKRGQEVRWFNTLTCEFVHLVYKDNINNVGIFEEVISRNTGLLDLNEEEVYLVPLKEMGRTECECGASHTSFPQMHMRFCPLSG